ncbi:cytochrome c [Pseudomonas sp. LS1212]|uniref:c-type cytochrome n=1 Tax=Pseudomonas sp. LS1212 TaxID=2972478 RepID=UPI00215CE964|nr:cytochrome c [Pseudomonas sp. LS1212]UVJ46176.1 cytochrome c [Pseudomonas sp. LS1212]
MKRTIKTLSATGVVTAIVGAGVVYFGVFNVGADDPHSHPVYTLLSTARDRSIEVRSRDIKVPELTDEGLIRAGAGNYNAMCIGCHLAPGLAQTELSKSLYPAPPNLSKLGVDGNPAAAFWIIKHGIKSTGMPAWGRSMADPYIWGMVAFLQQLPAMNAEQYRALAASSGGHQHGGGETRMHNHEVQHNGENEASSSGDASGVGGLAEADVHHDDTSNAHAHDKAVAPAPDESVEHAHPEGMGSSHDAPASSVAQPKTHTHADGKEHTHAQ